MSGVKSARVTDRDAKGVLGWAGLCLLGEVLALARKVLAGLRLAEALELLGLHQVGLHLCLVRLGVLLLARQLQGARGGSKGSGVDEKGSGNVLQKGGCHSIRSGVDYNTRGCLDCKGGRATQKERDTACKGGRATQKERGGLLAREGVSLKREHNGAALHARRVRCADKARSAPPCAPALPRGTLEKEPELPN